MILDLSFAARARRTTGRGPRGKTNRGQKRHHGEDIIQAQASVNDNTRRLAPDVPVKELGNVLPRLLDFIATVPAENTSTSRSWISPTDTGE
jgi:hypothetical protein